MGVGGGACGRWHWSFRWSSPSGNETCEVCAEIGAGGACGLWHWLLWWSSLRGVCRSGCGGRMCAVALVLSVEFPRATKRVKCVPNWAWGTHAGGGIGLSVELRMTPRNV
eukprot:6493389-Pyramimonas_sp.AAC.1